MYTFEPYFQNVFDIVLAVINLNDNFVLEKEMCLSHKLFLFSVFMQGQCAQIGDRKCTWGPSYWCSHLHHAKDCGAVQHCLNTVWANQKEGMMGTVRRILLAPCDSFLFGYIII